ncbi:hypothetical protein FRC17_003378 [Serendipita sp. 399]|nr:hypothetical protein FRC17_003378 [Serendipita sp. 399]
MSLSSYTTYNDPPSYATAIPSPDYSQAPLPSEELVESSLVPPPYITRVSSTSTCSSSSASSMSSSASSVLSLSGSSHRYSVDEYPDRSRTLTLSRPSTSNSRISQPAAPAPATPSPASSSSTERYISRAGSIELDLGPRREPEEGHPTGSSSFATYGLNGIIRGEIRLKKMSHVQSVIVSLEGRIQTMVIQGGVPSNHQERKLLHLPKALYTAAIDKPKDKGKAKEMSAGSRAFPFEFQIPTTIQDSEGEEPLPPTFRNAHPSMEGSVKYTIRVQVIKSGIWLRETLSTVIHYLPKFYLQPEALLWPAISLMDAKRFGLETNDKWRTSVARLVYTPQNNKNHKKNKNNDNTPLALPELSVSIPRTAQAVAHSCFPVNVTVRIPKHFLPSSSSGDENENETAEEEAIQKIVSDPERLSIWMIKRTTLIAGGGGAQKSSHVLSIGSAQQQQIERELVSRPQEERIVRAWFKAGTKHGEASWSVKDIVDVQYFIRVTLSLGDKQAPIFKHDEEIQMFSHSREQFENPFEAHDAPATALLLASSLSARAF